MADVQQWYYGLPPITRFFMTGCFLTSAAVYLKILTPLQLFLNFPMVFKRYEVARR
jgi:Derlin-2/3